MIAHVLATIFPKPCCLSLLHAHWNLDVDFFLAVPEGDTHDPALEMLPWLFSQLDIFPTDTPVSYSLTSSLSHVASPVNTVLTTLIELTFLITHSFFLTRYSRLAIFQLYSLLIFPSSGVSWILHFWPFYLFRLIQGELSMLCTIRLSSCTSDMTTWRTHPKSLVPNRRGRECWQRHPSSTVLVEPSQLVSL